MTKQQKQQEQAEIAHLDIPELQAELDTCLWFTEQVLDTEPDPSRYAELFERVEIVLAELLRRTLTQGSQVWH